MLRVGLTGGIATGKSTVASMLRDLECSVLEADPLAHELFEPGQAVYDEIVQEFGKGILDSAGKVVRKELGEVVFADPAKLARLNQIVHPRVLAVIEKWFDALDRRGGPEFAVAEAALLIESGFYKKMDRLIVTWCPPEEQRERLRGRGLSAEQIERRIAAQMPVDEKRQFADDVIDCSGALEETERQAGELVKKLKMLATAPRNI